MQRNRKKSQVRAQEKALREEYQNIKPLSLQGKNLGGKKQGRRREGEK